LHAEKQKFAKAKTAKIEKGDLATHKERERHELMFISRVAIKNFRSLTDVELELSNYTALVGLNDSGKSNLLRALNLFFNNQTDPDHPLNFQSDFSQHAKIVERKAKQIEIEIEFIPPTNYADNCAIIWRKTYRADSATPHEELFKKDGTAFKKTQGQSTGFDILLTNMFQQ
jgi:predicted ATP-dependent endonuclease of OLD family